MEIFLKRTGIYIIAILLALSFFKENGFFSNKKSEIIKSDGFGYYSYLPAMFIYGDYSQSFLPEKFPKYYQGTGIPEYMQIINNKPVDKYFFGTAVLMYPFFMTAHLAAIYFKQPADGYSILYQYLIGLSAVFYVFIGIFFCNRLLKLYNATTYQSLFICLLLVFATNLSFYAVIESSMSHAYSFAMISAFLYYAKATIDLHQAKFIIPAFLALGMVILIRPFNILIILSIPFLAGSLSKLSDTIRFLYRNYLYTFYGALLAFCIVSLQFLIWYKQTGNFLVYSYTYERFYFDKPNFFKVLFSYKRGIFIYTPLLFLSLAGLIFLFRKNRFSAISFILFFVILIFIMSCWYMWYYGASFGFRPIIDYYAVFSILILFSLNLFKKRVFRNIFITLCICTLFINQVQAYQYKRFIFHWYSMSEYKYWRIFLKTDPKWYGYVWDNPEPSDLPGLPVSSFTSDFEQPQKDWLGNSVFNVGEKAHSGKMVSSVYAENVYSNTLIINGKSNISKCAKPALIATGFIHVNSLFASDKLNLVVNYQKSDGISYYYHSRPVDNFSRHANGWKKFEVGVRLEKKESDADSIKVYFWNPEKKSFWIDDVTIKFVDVK